VSSEDVLSIKNVAMLIVENTPLFSCEPAADGKVGNLIDHFDHFCG